MGAFNKLLVVVFILVLVSFILSGCKEKEEEIRIGAILPLTGMESRQGELIQNAILMAMEEINNEGGINNKILKILLEDNKSEPKQTVAAYRSLHEIHGVKVILTIGSPMAMTLSPLVNEDRVILFGIAAAPAYKSLDDYTYRIIPSAIKEGEDLANFFYNELKIEKLAVIYINNDYGLGTKEAFTQAYIDLGGAILIEETFNPEETDFRTQLQKIKSKNPEGIYIASWGKQAGIIVRQATELGLEDTQFLCGQACQNPDLIKEGGSATEGLIYPYTYINTDTDFYANYLAKYGEEPTQISERMYDMVRLYAEILKSCGDNEESACLLGELQKIEFEGTSSIIKFDEYGDIIEDFVLYTVRDGNFVLLE